MRVHAIALLLVALVPTQCEGGERRDVGGDRNPRTGACEITYEETVGQKTPVYHRYPEMSDDGRYVYGKAIFVCKNPPDAHRATIHIEYQREGTWRSIGENSTSEIPRPRWSVFVQVSCRVGDWRLRVDINGTGRNADGHPQNFTVRDVSRTRYFNCKGR